MRRILTLIIEMGAHAQGIRDAVCTDGTRWFVGATSVNPAAARALVTLGLLLPLNSDDRDRLYALSPSARKKIAHLTAARSLGDDVNAEHVAAAMLDSLTGSQRHSSALRH